MDNMKEKEFLEEFEKKNIFRKGHFDLQSGRHSNIYVDKEALFLDADLRSRLCDALCLDLISAGIISDIDGVIAPGKGGIVYADTISRKLSLMTGRTIVGIFAEKEERSIAYYVPGQDPDVQKIFVRLGSFRFRKAFRECIPHKRFLAIEDVCTTGGTLGRVIDAIRLLGGIVEYAVCVINRGGIEEGTFVSIKKFISGIEKRLPDWEPSDCPQCKEHKPLDSPK